MKCRMCPSCFTYISTRHTSTTHFHGFHLTKQSIYSLKICSLFFATASVAYRQMKKKVPASFQSYFCRLRVLDSFGTQAPFNSAGYFSRHKAEIGGSKRNAWGGFNMDLQQFYSMYPHSADNSFLGFVIDNYLNESSVEARNLTRNEKWALVYGKEAYMWTGKEQFLSWIHDMGVEIHATVNDDPKFPIPGFVVNHGVQSGPAFHAILRQVKLFIGLGFPYEGPAPLEAIANGAIFLNPLFDPPKSRLTEKFFAEKPTLRQLTSQNPYAEHFVGEPYVISVDVNNRAEVESAVRKALSSAISPYLPYEFTAEDIVQGLLERINAYVEHQDFCAPPELRNWPPYSALTILHASESQSCSDACWQQKLVCEPSYFSKINALSSFDTFSNEKGSIARVCLLNDSLAELSAPFYEPESKKCVLQRQKLLFNCASYESNQAVLRLCPCRDYVKDQTALCVACL